MPTFAAPGDVPLKPRPLIVTDVDEVVLEFLTPFIAFLEAREHVLLPRSFRLAGNIIDRPSGEPVSEATAEALLEAFYTVQDQWQTPAALAVETLTALSEEADIVFLTAMPPRHAPLRTALLDALGLPYPLIASEEPKGPLVKHLHGERRLPLVFIDDILRNLHSVQEHAPSSFLINLMANAEFRALAPTPAAGIQVAADWGVAAGLIRAHWGATTGG
ncbi:MULTISPECIES: hypothetical protein [Sinorhizobium]|uniref:Uncharacterized protein n=1 Tax=Sinorhizobium americanum TaxID=194963 RepID=A0A2S3YGL2_9HYPH|nr:MULTISPECIES: hypothetical protein [Sinorhizobium]PDT40287.1 hypothetical protein CO656_16320 [Sinorhizobium sp. FG01]POH25521.1 hypothetical protein ATY31_26000 [Sinorhizobium americanum]